MVGLKTFWILLSTLFLTIACVPQTKQTECGANEAFNASLRTCVPIIGGPSSFINITSYSPMFTQTRSKDDPTPLEFKITVSNPYNQSYSVEWERVYNAGPESICTNSLTCSFPATILPVGTHIITAKVKDGNGTVVDTHSFELKVDDLAKPTILPASIVPSFPTSDRYPTDPRIEFSFTVKNNIDLNDSQNYRVEWSVTKNGSLQTSLGETDYFTNFAAGGTNFIYYGTPPTPKFNPSALGVGLYVVRAVVRNDFPGEIVAEQQWSFYIKQPDLADVTVVSNPSPGVNIVAHHNVSYAHAALNFPTRSWTDPSVPDLSAPHNRFCITVNDGDGTYPGDGLGIMVRWYLDSTGGEICAKRTQDIPGNQTICLIDANPCEGTGAPFNTDLLKFSNISPMSTETHKVTARLVDEATTYEFTAADVSPSQGGYPITWQVRVDPVNTPPNLNFGSAANNPAGCVSAGSFTRSGCQVTQGHPFKVSFSVTDDFYSGLLNPEEFMWNIQLKKNGSDLTSPDTSMNTSCSKAFGTSVTLPVTHTTGYTTEWTCTLNVPHYTVSGPLHPSDAPIQVVLTAQDSGSPVGGTGLVAQSLTWNLDVTESNDNIAPQTDLKAQTASIYDSHISKGATVLNPADPASYALEGETILFNLKVEDKELDDFRYSISLCTDNTASCTNPVEITSPIYLDFIRSTQGVPSANPVIVPGFLYTIPEDFLIGRHQTPIDIDTSTSHLVYFKVNIVDKPSIPTTPTHSDSKIFRVYVRNYNPAPVINTATASPALNSTTVVYSGYPVTIYPGVVTDASVYPSERQIKYQWYAKTGAGSWTAIPGAQEETLRYTPGNITTTIELKVCVGDGTAAHPVSPTGICAGSWFITPKKYLHNLAAPGALSLQNELAVWYDTTNTVPDTQVVYSAYVDISNKIYVEKTIKDSTGNIVLSTNTIQFDALASGTAAEVTNLSITGSNDSIYVAYIASNSSSTGTFVPRIRRISKNFDMTNPAQAKINLAHPAPFGFNYTHYPLACVPTTNCTTMNGDGIGGAASITFTAPLATGEQITVAGVTFTAVNSPSSSTEICDSTSCSTVNSMATNVANKINSSTIASLHGLTARSTGATVEIYGQYENDYLDFDGSISGVPGLTVAQNGLGKIFVIGGRWHLPMINSSLPGAEQNNITILSGAADIHLRSIGLALNTSDTLTEMGKTALFDAKLNTNGELVFARISAELGSVGSLALFRYTLLGADWNIFDESGGSPTDRNSMQIFGSYKFEYVKLAANKPGNPYYYVIAREIQDDGGEYHIGRYNFELDTAAPVAENFLTDKVELSDSTDDVITDTKIKFPDVVSLPNYPEARLFFHSVGTGSTPYPRLARWASDNTVSCGSCFPINGSLEYQGTSRIGISEVANDIALGSPGFTVNENIKDVVFVLMSSDVNNDDIFKPQLGIINIESEAIQSTNVSSSGLFQPPFVLDK